jgi:hypothetical protein
MTYGQDLLNKLKSNREKSDIRRISDETEGSFIGAGIGTLVSLFIGYKRKENLFISAFIGAAIGGLTSKFLIRKKPK